MVNNTLILIDILYNPASYTDSSWLVSLGLEESTIRQLPETAINHLLIHHYCTPMAELSSQSIPPAGWFFLNHWEKLHDVAWLLGLKSVASSIVHTPYFFQRLSLRQLQFFSCPLWLPTIPATPQLNQQQIITNGVQLLFNAAAALLPSSCLDRLHLIFSQDLPCQTPTDYPGNPLAFAAVQQAIHYV